MIVLAGGDLVLPDCILARGSLAFEGPRIAAIVPEGWDVPLASTVVDVAGCYVVPGFVDVHVHGVDGYDTQDEGQPIAAIASRLPRYGVTAFAPTTVACAPAVLQAVLEQVATLRREAPDARARVLPAHLESNFISPAYRGAQPAECLRLPGDASLGARHFSARDILDVIAAAGAAVGTVTLAPELPGALDLVRALVAAGHAVSLGHSGATLDETMAAIDAGATRATHLFNRMSPMTHRAPGITGAVLSQDDVTAELICDGHHVHPAMCRLAIRSKGVERVMAVTDGTAGSGLAVGSSARLGGQRIRVEAQGAVLEDGTWAGSTLTMDRAFRTIVTRFGFSVHEATVLCSTTPARASGLIDCGRLVENAVADVTVLDRHFEVVRTFVGGREVYARDGAIEHLERSLLW